MRNNELIQAIIALIKQHRPDMIKPDGEEEELIAPLKPAEEEETKWE